MLSLFLFLLFFIFIAYLFDCYCFEGLKKTTTESSIRLLNVKSIIFISLIVLVPTLLVGFRSESTGVDTARYIQLFYYPREFLVWRASSSSEFLFWGIYLLCKDFGNLRLCFFILAFIPLFFTFAGLYKLSRICNPFVSSLLFLLFFYNEFFNATRQCPAIALVFYSYTFCLSRKFIPFLLCILAATLFHSTAILALPIYFLYPSRELDSWGYFCRFFLFGVTLVGASFFLGQVLNLDSFSRYASYQEKLYQVTIGQAFTSFLVNYFPLILLMIVFNKKTKFLSNEEKRFYSFLWLVSILFCQIILMRYINNWLFRIAYYYQLGEILITSIICSKIYKVNPDSKGRYTISSSDILILLVVLSYHFKHNMAYYSQSALTNFSLME